MHRQSECNSRHSGVKRKRQLSKSENRENKRFSKHFGSAERKNIYKSGSKDEFEEQEQQQQSSSPLSSPLTPRNVFTSQPLNRMLNDYSASFQKLEKNDFSPTLTWAKWEQLWHVMCSKDKDLSGKRNPRLFEQSPDIRPRMRSILLDWMTEVCEAYKIHRETYYLAVDYIDRYLSSQTKVLRSQLQLIGVTCLFIAAKVEEIYPPKLMEFAFVTDKACKAEQIIDMELVILKTLDWNLVSVTAHSWLNLFTQICNINSSSNGNLSNYSVMFPNHSIKEYLQSSQLLDLCILDAESLKFSYSVLAASAIYLTSYTEQILKVSGFQWSDISECVEWMHAFAQALKEEKATNSPYRIQVFSSNVSTDVYQKQTHSVDLNLLEKAQSKLQNRVTNLSTPSHKVVFLTPPSSNKKSCSSNTELSCG